MEKEAGIWPDVILFLLLNGFMCIEVVMILRYFGSRLLLILMKSNKQYTTTMSQELCICSTFTENISVYV